MTDPAIDTDCHEAGHLGGIHKPVTAPAIVAALNRRGIGAQVVNEEKFLAALRASQPDPPSDAFRGVRYAFALTALALLTALAVAYWPH